MKLEHIVAASLPAMLGEEVTKRKSRTDMEMQLADVDRAGQAVLLRSDRGSGRGGGGGAVPVHRHVDVGAVPRRLHHLLVHVRRHRHWRREHWRHGVLHLDHIESSQLM